MATWYGLNINFWEHMILEVSVEVIIYDLGFQVFSRNCSNCHGMMYKKYDTLLDKVNY